MKALAEKYISYICDDMPICDNHKSDYLRLISHACMANIYLINDKLKLIFEQNESCSDFYQWLSENNFSYSWKLGLYVLEFLNEKNRNHIIDTTLAERLLTYSASEWLKSDLSNDKILLLICKPHNMHSVLAEKSDSTTIPNKLQKVSLNAKSLPICSRKIQDRAILLGNSTNTLNDISLTSLFE